MVAYIALALACVASAAPESSVSLRGAPNATAAQSAVLRSSSGSSWQHAGCCNGCRTAFCSPESGSCYDYKGKYYYLECTSGGSSSQGARPHADCCGRCDRFCSPQSGTCYEFAAKDYYLTCMHDSQGPSRPGRPFGSNVGDWEQVAGQVCTQSGKSRVFYDLPSRTACKEKCESTEFPWCQLFQYGDASASCGRSMCELLSDCSSTESASCWAYYFVD